MIDPNQITIDAYNNEAEKYINKTPHEHQDYHRPMLNWINAALDGLKGTKVLEIGSATLRDASYIRKRGFDVQMSDASQKLVDFLKEKGETPLLLNILKDPLPKGFDLIFANAVAPHFTPADLTRFLNKITQSATPKSRLAFNLKTGTGDAWINEKFDNKRYVHYWQPVELEKLLSNYDLNVIFFDTNVIGDRPNHRWINIVVEKQ